MKITVRILAICIILFSNTIFAQAPQGINYQAIARNSSGALLANQAIAIEISITNGNGGTLLFKEQHFPTTNQFGLFTLNVGNGTASTGTFSTINWASVNAWMQIAMDENGGTNFTVMGSSQLLSVPYALNAATSSDNKWVSSGNDIYNVNTGNVGIGTSTPLAKLNVQQGVDTMAAFINMGNPAATSDVLFVNNNGSGNGIYAYNGNTSNGQNAVLGVSNNSGNAIAGVNSNSGNAVYGFQSGQGSSGYFQIYNPSNTSNGLTSVTNGSGSAAYFANSSTGAAITTGAGNVGLGVSSPNEKLHVQGNIRMEDGNQAAGKVMTSDNYGKATWADLPPNVTVNSGFRVFSNSSQVIPTGTSTQVTWSEEYDDANAFSGDAFTAQATGLYHFDVYLMGSYSNTGLGPNYFQDITIQKNGVPVVTTYGHGLWNAQMEASYNVNTDLKLNAGDVITVWIRQFSTLDMVLFPSSEYCSFTGHRVY